MHLTCTGLTHRNAPLSLRERFYIPRERMQEAVFSFKQNTGALECIILSTCNRIEFYRVDAAKPDARGDFLRFYQLFGAVDGDGPQGAENPNLDNKDRQNADEVGSFLFIRQGSSVARHLFKVTAGLDSVLVGETQVAAQVRDAYSIACSVNGPGTFLHKLFHFAFQTSKQVRTALSFESGATGLATAAFEMLTRRCGIRMSGAKVVIIGVNRSTEMLIAKLSSAGAQVTIVNRTLERAVKAAKPFGAKAMQLSELGRTLNDNDIVITVTSAGKYLISPLDLANQNGSRPLILVDLAAPRNIDPTVAELPGICLFDLDDIKRYLDDIQVQRSSETVYGLQIIDDQVAAYEIWRQNRLNGINDDLRQTLEADRRELIARFSDRFHEGEIRSLEAFSRQLYRRFLRRSAEASALKSVR